MKSAVPLGIVLAVLILAASVSPILLAGGGRKAAARAREQAALANRTLARFSAIQPRVEARAAAGSIEDAHAEAAAEDWSEALESFATEFTRRARENERWIQERGLPKPSVPSPAGDASALLRSVRDYDAWNAAQSALLGKAVSEAQAAMTAGGQVVSVPAAAGMANFVVAEGYHLEAQALRDAQAVVEAQLLNVGTQWQKARSMRDHANGLDVAPILAQLNADIEEIALERAAANQERDRLQDEVTQRQRELAEVESALQTASRALMTLEEAGFAVGDDESFANYRAQHEAVTAQLRDLEQRRQELQYGGLHGAVVADFDDGEVVGGTTVVGLEELERAFRKADARAKRYENAHIAMQEHIRFVTEFGRTARAEVARQDEQIRELAEFQKTLVEQIGQLATDAFNKEEQALDAIRKSVSAYQRAQAAATAWQNAARDTQRTKDPERKNVRLDMIVRDSFTPHVGASAEAAARMLEGRILADRIDATQRLIDNMRLFGEMNPDFMFDDQKFVVHIQTAREQGKDSLEKAAELYTAMTERFSGAPTVWISQGALAAAYHLLSRVDAASAGTWAQQSAQTIEAAVRGREHFPYVRRSYLAFREHMASGRPGAQPETGGKDEDFFFD